MNILYPLEPEQKRQFLSALISIKSLRPNDYSIIFETFNLVLTEIDRTNRTERGESLIQSQGRAQVLAEVLELADNAGEILKSLAE